MKKVFIYGTGGHGREIAEIARVLKNNNLVFSGFIDDKMLPTVNEKEVYSLQSVASEHPESFFVPAVGDTKIKASLIEKCLEVGLKPISLIHPSVEISPFTSLKEGVVIFPGSVLTVNIQIGSYVHINSNCSISHDVKIGDFSILSPGCNICGNVQIGKNVFIGAGTTVKNGTQEEPIIITDNTTIGAGACVTKSIKTSGVYAGVPAKLLNKDK